MYLGAAPLAATTLALMGGRHQTLPYSNALVRHAGSIRGGGPGGELSASWDGRYADDANLESPVQPTLEILGDLSYEDPAETWIVDGKEVTYSLHEVAADATKLEDLIDMLRASTVDTQALDASGDTAFTVACLAKNPRAALLLLNYKFERGNNYDDGLSMADMLWQFMYSFPSLTTRDADVSDYDNAEDDNKLATMFAMIVQTMHETYSGQLDSRLPVYGALLSWTSTEKKSLTDPWLTEAVDGIASEVYDERGRTPLHYAALNPNINPDVATRLLATTDLRPYMITTDGYGWTPLHFAAMAGNVEVAKLLLNYENDANINARDARGKTARYLAMANGQLDLADMLYARGGKL